MGEREVSAVGSVHDPAAAPAVLAVSLNSRHRFSKQPQLSIHLVAELGIKGDAHYGATVQHLHRKRYHPELPNLRQVHLLHSELFPELAQKGFQIGPGDMGENITTATVDLLGLPRGTRLHLGVSAIVEVTGLRDPCILMDRFLPGLMAATLERDASGSLMRKAGIMSIVAASGTVFAGDPIRVELPPLPHQPLQPV